MKTERNYLDFTDIHWEMLLTILKNTPWRPPFGSWPRSSQTIVQYCQLENCEQAQIALFVAGQMFLIAVCDKSPGNETHRK
jgi:hypothetical protein